MRKVWQKVFEDTSVHRVEIVKAILEGEGLNPVIIDLKDSSYHFGNLELIVNSIYALEPILDASCIIINYLKV